MHLQRRDYAPRNERGGQVSRLLFAPQLGSTRLGVTWVRGEPGSQQGLHPHDHSEQVYVVVRGRGLMIVDDEALEIEAGSAVLIPAPAKHAIRNTGIEPLEYISATAPPFPAEISGDTWQPRYERSAWGAQIQSRAESVGFAGRLNKCTPRPSSSGTTLYLGIGARRLSGLSGP